jgi:hypothetical protein
MFIPIAPIKSDGAKVSRSWVARDLTCILDVNSSVSAWTCMPPSLDIAEMRQVPDFAVLDMDGKL